jgi:hypothetical protein
LRDLSCVWYESYEAHRCLGENSDHITAQVMCLGQLSINKTDISSENSSNLRSSPR